jgi:hypothetical protein
MKESFTPQKAALIAQVATLTHQMYGHLPVSSFNYLCDLSTDELEFFKMYLTRLNAGESHVEIMLDVLCK